LRQANTPSAPSPPPPPPLRTHTSNGRPHDHPAGGGRGGWRQRRGPTRAARARRAGAHRCCCCSAAPALPDQDVRDFWVGRRSSTPLASLPVGKRARSRGPSCARRRLFFRACVIGSTTAQKSLRQGRALVHSPHIRPAPLPLPPPRPQNLTATTWWTTLRLSTSCRGRPTGAGARHGLPACLRASPRGHNSLTPSSPPQ
jgi:hypothetical protein